MTARSRVPRPPIDSPTDTAPDAPGAPGAPEPATAKARATTRGAKGSVHEAIGKLIGDDAARERGTAEKRAAAADAAGIKRRPGT